MTELTRIIAIRHGQTAWNAEARLQGQLDIPLNLLGRRQAATLAQALRDEDLSAVITSDLGRARDTAVALAEPLGLPLATERDLRERSFGLLEGLTYRQIDEQWPEQARRWRSREPDFAPAGGESLRTFYARSVAAVERLAAAHVGRSIVLVSHGGVLDCLYRAAARIALDAPRTWVLGNAAVNRLLHTPEGFTLVGWNDSSHLDGLALNESAA